MISRLGRDPAGSNSLGLGSYLLHDGIGVFSYNFTRYMLAKMLSRLLGGLYNAQPIKSRIIECLSFAALLLLFAPTLVSAQTAKATFAGGCFWCMEPPFDELAGVISTTSGYTAGKTKNPTYEQVSSGSTGHTEALQVV